jgi:hypothetical protein
MPLLSKKTCGHAGRAPRGTMKCSKAQGHGGLHGARGLKWGSDGKIQVGSKGTRR